MENQNNTQTENKNEQQKKGFVLWLQRNLGFIVILFLIGFIAVGYLGYQGYQKITVMDNAITANTDSLTNFKKQYQDDQSGMISAFNQVVKEIKDSAVLADQQIMSNVNTSLKSFTPLAEFRDYKKKYEKKFGTLRTMVLETKQSGQVLDSTLKSERENIKNLKTKVDTSIKVQAFTPITSGSGSGGTVSASDSLKQEANKKKFLDRFRSDPDKKKDKKKTSKDDGNPKKLIQN